MRGPADLRGGAITGRTFAGRASGVLAAAAALSACEQPEWRTRLDPMPALPAWAQPLQGRLLDEAFTLAPASASL